MTDKIVTPASVKTLMRLTPMRYYLGNDMVEAMPYPHHGEPGMLVLRESKEGELSSVWMSVTSFNRRFTSVQNLSFGQAMQMREQGLFVSRQGWQTGGGEEKYLIRSTNPIATALGVDSQNFYSITTKSGNPERWMPEAEDMFATDWYLCHYAQDEQDKEKAYGSHVYEASRFSAFHGHKKVSNG